MKVDVLVVLERKAQLYFCKAESHVRLKFNITSDLQKEIVVFNTAIFTYSTSTVLDVLITNATPNQLLH